MKGPRINPFLSRLARGPLLGDGAMGTQLHLHGIPFERCFDELNLTEPRIVEEIHREYIRAGAELIETNTFGANRIKLARHGLEAKVRDINLRAVKLAREAREVSGEPVFLAGSVGPIGQTLQPVGRITLAEAQATFREQIEGLLEGGADLLVLETFTNLPELLAAVQAARAAALGVASTGGCCAPPRAHIAAMRAALSPKTMAQLARPVRPEPAIPLDLAPTEDLPPTPFGQRLQERRFVISVEIDPPRGLNPAKCIAGAELVKDAGADAVNIGDSPMARVRMSALALALMIRQQVGLDPIIHFTTRDKNLMALQAELIGAHAMGVR